MLELFSGEDVLESDKIYPLWDPVNRPDRDEIHCEKLVRHQQYSMMKTVVGWDKEQEYGIRGT